MLRRKTHITERSICGIVLLAVLPDILQLVPIVGWVAVGGGSIRSVYEYVLATPGTEPVFPPIVQSLVHHPHWQCTVQSLQER